MLLLVDGGSSQLHIGWWEHNRVIRAENIAYPESTKELEILLHGYAGEHVVDGTAACSVSANWRETLFAILLEIYPWKFRVARTAADIGVRVPYERPETYGIDRALAVKAAYRRFHTSCVVADLGTALTVDAVNADGSVAGGFIMPGSALQASSLAMATCLPQVSMDASTSALGTSTEESIRLGIRYGFHAAAENLIDRAVQAVNAGERILLTGGCAAMLGPELSTPHEIIPHLVIEGLGHAFEQLKPFT